MSRYGDLMTGLGREIGLDLSAAESPVEIRVDDFPVTLTAYDSAGNGDIVFSAILGRVPEAAELQVYRVMLDANVFWTATADATLGVNADTREAVVCFRTPMADLDPRGLADMLDTFLFVARNWANFLDIAATGDAVDAAAPGEQFFIRA